MSRWTSSAVLWLAACSNDVTPPGDAGLDGPDGAAACVTPQAGMTISHDTTLCAGTFSLPVASGNAAVVVAADGVTLTCAGTVLDGQGQFATTQAPTVGIQVGAIGGVTIRHCTVQGFRYGIAAKGSTNLTLDDVHLDHNFDDPAADWTEDSVQGGGVRLEDVTGGTLSGSSMSNDWNGVELRGTSGFVVSASTATHCSNTGALLVGATGCTLEDNDFSWAVRGGLTYPGNWYGVDTKDSAGIILDAGSTKNTLSHNTVQYGGDGIFIRTIIGACAPGNLVEDNDVSFSPHNGIESWCDDNQFVGNTANDCNYGMWTGGSDRALISHNTVQRSRVDGISVQIGEDRHTRIEGNVVTDSARCGLLLSGREYQQWQALDNWGANLANSSHLVVQGNVLSNNAAWDVFSTSTRSLVYASNCGAGKGAPRIDDGKEVEVYKAVGSCGAAAGHVAPTAALGGPYTITAGASVTLDASASSGSSPLAFTWLVQPAGTSFAQGALPAMVFGGPGGATQPITPASPGVYDADVTVDDGVLAAQAWTTLFVLPAGPRVGALAADWTYVCTSAPSCKTTFADEPGGVDGGTQVHVSTDAPYDFAAIAPASKNLGLDASGYGHFGLFVRARDANTGGWQINSPVVVLASAAGSLSYTPSQNFMPIQPDEWLYISIPLAGDAVWTRSGTGSLSKVDWIELHTDTWGAGVDIWLDALTFTQ